MTASLYQSSLGPTAPAGALAAMATGAGIAVIAPVMAARLALARERLLGMDDRRHGRAATGWAGTAWTHTGVVTTGWRAAGFMGG